MYGSGEMILRKSKMEKKILRQAKTDYANSDVGFYVLFMLRLLVLVFLIVVFSVAAKHEIVWQWWEILFRKSQMEGRFFGRLAEYGQRRQRHGTDITVLLSRHIL